jgi:hypothetical protein
MSRQKPAVEQAAVADIDRLAAMLEFDVAADDAAGHYSC